MEVITILAMGFVCAVCFLLGAKVGQAVSKGEKVELPNPVKAVEDHRAKKEAEMEQSRIEIIMRNIESYDGTPYGQEDVPGR
jgi:Na+-transporting methylmalonyl-CoA/oxaloacetate decarboxylase gamma subunit